MRLSFASKYAENELIIISIANNPFTIQSVIAHPTPESSMKDSRSGIIIATYSVNLFLFFYKYITANHFKIREIFLYIMLRISHFSLKGSSGKMIHRICDSSGSSLNFIWFSLFILAFFEIVDDYLLQLHNLAFMRLSMRR